MQAAAKPTGSTKAHAPSGWRRFLRDRARAWAALVLVGAVLVAPALQAATRTSVTAAIAENWRGLYDLLVTAPQEGPVFTDSTGAELVDPNFGNVSGGVIPQSQVAEVSALEGVEVAAPVGLVGRWGNTMDFAFLAIPAPVFASEAAQTFRIEWSTSSDDGLDSRLVQDDVGYLSVDVSGWDGVSSGRFADVGIAVSSSIAVDGGVRDGELQLSWVPLPVVASTVFAVDPVAEQALLGQEAGAFLDPLIEVDAMLTSAGQVTAGAVAQLPVSDPVRSELAALPGAEWALSGMYGEENPVTPYLRNVAAFPPLELTAGFSRAPAYEADVSTIAQQDAAGQVAWLEVGQTAVDLSQERRPFAGSSVFVPWPGTTTSSTNYFITPDASTGLSPLTLSEGIPPAVAASGSAERTHLTVAPQGFVRPVPNLARTPLDGSGLGQEQTYRTTDGGLGADLGTWNLRGAAPFEVGTYAPGELDLSRSGAAYVPLGAYDPGRVSSGEASLEPTSHGLGLAAQASSAVVSLLGAAAFGVTDVATAIRVRVAGVEGYDAGGRERVEQVAQEIRGLGLQVRVVAGASPQEVAVWVPSYAFGTDDAAQPQQVGDLGWVSMDFTTLGAASRTQATFEGTGAVLALLAVAAGLLASLTVLLVAGRERRGQVRLLREVGFAPSEVRRWFWSQDAPAILAVAAAGAVAAWLWRQPWLLAAPALVLVAVVAIGFALPRHPHEPVTRRRRSRVRRGVPRQLTPVRLALVVSRPGAGMLLVRALSMCLMAVAAALGAALVTTAVGESALTQLGSLTSARVLPLVLATIVVIAAAGWLMIVATERAVRARRQARSRVLRQSSMWPAGAVWTVAAVEQLLITGLAAVGAAGILALTLGEERATVLAIAGAAGLATLIVSALLATRASTKRSGHA